MSKSKTWKASAGVAKDPEAAPLSATPEVTNRKVDQPRAGSKQALLVDLLGREGGATLADLTGATGWLPYTARAALTGLRKRGFAIERVAVEGSGSAYRMAPEVDAEPAPASKRRAGRRSPKQERAAA